MFYVRFPFSDPGAARSFLDHATADGWHGEIIGADPFVPARAAQIVVGALVSLPADPRDALLELHRALVAIDGYHAGANETMDELLAALEARILAGGGQIAPASLRVARADECAR